MTIELDETDHKLLRLLQSKARAPVSELANDLHAPRTTVAHRLSLLEQRKVIRRYTVYLDHESLGMGQTAFIMVQIGPNPIRIAPDLCRKISHVPGVEEIHSIAGEWDLVVKMRAQSVKSMLSSLENITKEPEVLRTVTLPCFRTYLEWSFPEERHPGPAART